jgi:hypothetical protein
MFGLFRIADAFNVPERRPSACLLAAISVLVFTSVIACAETPAEPPSAAPPP